MDINKKLLVFVVFIIYALLMLGFAKLSEWLRMLGLEEIANQMLSIFLIALIVITLIGLVVVYKKIQKQKNSMIKGRNFF